jgi:hypothetical protein
MHSGTVLASSLSEDEIKDATGRIPQAGGRGVLDQAAKKQARDNAKKLCGFLYTELSGDPQAAINLANQIIVECKKMLPVVE